MKTILNYLEQYCDELTPREFYREIFPEGELERKGEYVDGKYTAIAVCVNQSDKKVKRYTVTDDLDKIDYICHSDDFSIMSPISYVGKSRKSENARFLYALAIDVDGIRIGKADREYPSGIETLFFQFDGNGRSNYLPKPTMIVFSGTGLHIYYVFEKPIPLFKNIAVQLETLKRRLTWQLWTQGVTDLQNSVQFESLFQGFRMPGTITKDGKRARAFLVDRGKKVTIEYLNKFVPEEYRTTDFSYKSDLTLEQAKRKYPEWYKKRIVEHKPRGSWTVKRDLYDWWKRKIVSEAKDGGRYWAIFALATYAKKCGISRDELENDALSFVELLDSIGEREDNPFTVDDVVKALEAYNDSYITYPRATIAERTMISIPPNKRNGRKQSDHIKLMNFVRDELNHNTNWREGNGRPKGSTTAKSRVYEWRRQHPYGRKAACIRDTGLSKPTVYKWWDYVPSDGGSISVKIPIFSQMTDDETKEWVEKEFTKERERVDEQNNKTNR